MLGGGRNLPVVGFGIRHVELSGSSSKCSLLTVIKPKDNCLIRPGNMLLYIL
jgi:hypothetical protein